MFGASVALVLANKREEKGDDVVTPALDSTHRAELAKQVNNDEVKIPLLSDFERLAELPEKSKRKSVVRKFFERKIQKTVEEAAAAQQVTNQQGSYKPPK